MSDIKTKDDVIALGFFNERRWLSNMWETPIYYGHVYPSVENAYQASKTRDTKEKEVFTRCSPKESKSLGRKLNIREDWDQVKPIVMYTLTYLKYSKNQNLKRKLILTGTEELIEHNYWGDKYWGKHFGEGSNMLGKTLMAIRFLLTKE
jgi:ribA/ribD-fused uncharacterized protein